MPSCVVKNVTRPIRTTSIRTTSIRNGEAPTPERHLA
jgi:hypothetical protein